MNQEHLFVPKSSANGCIELEFLSTLNVCFGLKNLCATIPGVYNSNENEIAYIVNCVDREDDASIERTKADSIAISKIAPHFGPYIAWSALPCDYWPYPPIRPPVELSGPNLPPFLMVGTTRDPATPYEWAQSVSNRFPSAILITADGDGHTGHGRGSACVDDAVDSYLLKGTLPGGALTCTL